jgi:tetratricopeptide repeat protein 21B
MADVNAMVNYYARMGFHRHIQTICSEMLRKKGQDVTLLFWRAYAMGAEGSLNEAIRELEGTLSRRETEFPVMCHLIYAHRKCEMPDMDTIDDLERGLSSAEGRANTRGLLLAASFYNVVKQSDDARRLVGRVLEAEPQNMAALTLRGWVDLMAPQETRHDKDVASKSLQYFEQVCGWGGGTGVWGSVGGGARGNAALGACGCAVQSRGGGKVARVGIPEIVQCLGAGVAELLAWDVSTLRPHV